MKILFLLSMFFLSSCGGYLEVTQANLQTAETTNSYIIEGNVSTIAGTLNSSGYLDGIGTNAKFNCAYGIVSDHRNGDLYVADTYNYVIRKINSAGVVTTVAGTVGVSGNVDANGLNARLGDISEIVMDSVGNFFLADKTNYSIRMMTPTGTVSTFSADPDLTNIYGIDIDANDNLYAVMDIGNNQSKLLKFSPSGVKTIIRSDFPAAIKVKYDNLTGSIYVAGQNVIYKLDASYNRTIFAGGGTLTGGQNGFKSDVIFNWNWDMEIGQDGSLYVMDAGNYILRRIDPDGEVTHIAGTYGVPGATDGMGLSASFNWVEGLTISKEGYIYMIDCGSKTVRMVR